MKKLTASGTARLVIPLVLFLGFTSMQMQYHPFVLKLMTQLNDYGQAVKSEKVYLQFDRNFYQPGDDIWFKAYIRNADDLTQDDISDVVYVELIDPKGTSIAKEKVLANNGNGAGVFTLNKGVGGLYKIKAYTNWQKNTNTFFERSIQVQKVNLPNLNMKLDYERKAYGGGDQVEAKLELEQLSNQPLRYAEYEYIVQLDGKELYRKTEQTDFDGKATITFNLPETLQTNDALLQVLIPHQGNTESISRSIPIVLNDIDLQFFPEGGDMVGGLKTRLAFKALNEFGKPADIEGNIYNSSNELVYSFKSFHQGMGSFNFWPDPHVKYHAKITKPAGIEKIYQLPDVKTRGYSLNVVEQNESLLKVAVQSTRYTELHLVAQSNDKLLFSSSFNIDDQKIVEIPTGEFPMGISRLTLFDKGGNSHCERLVFVNPHERLSIAVKTDKEKYLPREKVVMDIEIKDENGKPVAGNFSLSVADSKLLTFADDKQGHIFSKIFLESELKGTIEEPDFYFDQKEPKAIAGLDLLMMTHGWRRFNWEAVKGNAPIANTYVQEKSTIAGKVVDECGQPIENARVVLNDKTAQTKTDELGNFELNGVALKAIGNSISIKSKNRPTIVKSIVDYKTDFYIIQAKGHGMLSGKILRPDGQNAYNVFATLYSDDGSKWTTRTGYPRGEYAFHQVPPGEYTLRFSFDRYRPHQIERIRIWPGSKLSISRQLKDPSEELQMFVSRYDEEMEQLNSEYLSNKNEKATPPNQIAGEKQEAVFQSVDRGNSRGGGVNLECIVVVEYKEPLIQQDNTTQGSVLTAEEIAVLPTRNIGALAAMTAGVTQVDDGDPISIRGSRPGSSNLYVDGIRVRASMISASDIEQMQVLTGGIPASFGGGTAVVQRPDYEANPKLGLSGKSELRKYIQADGDPLAYETATGSLGGASGAAVRTWRGSGSYHDENQKYYRKRPREIYHVVDSRPRIKIKSCEKIWDLEACEACAEEYLVERFRSTIEKYHHNRDNARYNGNSVLQFYVDKLGNVGDVRIRNESHSYSSYTTQKLRNVVYQLNKKKWIPARRDGKKVAAWYTVPLTYGDLHKFRPTNYEVPRDFYAPKYHVKTDVEQRSDFRSTIYWNPNVAVGADGKAQIEFWNSDDLTTFTTTIEGFSDGGLVGAAKHDYYTQMPFSMLAKTPVSFLTGDQVRIPITLTNNMEKSIGGSLKVQVPDCFEVLSPADGVILLKAGESKTVYPEYKVSFDCPKGVTNQQIIVKFKSNGIGDAFVQSIEVNASSFPIHQLFTGSDSSNIFHLDIKNPQKGSLEMNFEAHPNIVTEAMSSLERMLRQPNGCFEQTSSTTYPNLLVLQYMKKHPKEFNSEIKKKAEKYLDLGYKRLTGFEVKGGGYQWFGRNPAHEGLTAYGVLEFTDMKAVYPVDEKMLQRTTDWLLSRRDKKGSWLPGNKGLHKWAGGSEVRDAYIVWALCEAGQGDKVELELKKSYDDALKTKDPYVMALVANALFQRSDSRAEFLLKSLLKKQEDNGSFLGKTNSITASRGRNLHIETTALTVLAMMESKHIAEQQLEKAVQFIAKSKTTYGYGSTQSTILALKALIEYADYFKVQEEFNGEIQLFVNQEPIGNPIRYNSRQTTKLMAHNLGQYLEEGAQNVEVRFVKSKKALPFELQLTYHSKIPQLQESECKIDLRTELQHSQIPQGETVRLTTHLQNTTDELQASPLAIIGIPAGLSPQPWQLKEIQERLLIDYYEVTNDKVVFYFETLAPNETKTIHLDLKADIPGTYESPASCAYLYYENDAIDWVASNSVTVLTD